MPLDDFCILVNPRAPPEAPQTSHLDASTQMICRDSPKGSRTRFHGPGVVIETATPMLTSASEHGFTPASLGLNTPLSRPGSIAQMELGQH